MTRIKLCGMKRPCDIDYANELMPDYIGFIFAPKSKRYVTFDEASELRSRLSPGITPVGVFCNESLENIKQLIDNNIIDIIQLHGHEDNEYIQRLRAITSYPIIKAFHIENEADIKLAKESAADYIMLDSGGGTGKAFDHSLIRYIKRDFFLAGGLTPQNVSDAILKTNPFAVDASSSLETDGVKDKNKMTAFVNAVRQGKD